MVEKKILDSFLALKLPLVLMNQINFKPTSKPLNSYVDTVKQVFRLARDYHKDLLDPNKYKVRIASFNPKEFFEFIRSLPYVKDPKGIEFVNRPKISILLSGTTHPFDCDDRTVLSLSYFILRNTLNKIQGKEPEYQYRIVVVGRNQKPHHIYMEYKTEKSNWIPFDPTYPHNEYGIEPFTPGYRKEFYESEFYF